MKCYICRRQLGEEAGWTFCDDCANTYGNKTLRELVESGQLVVIEDDGYRITFRLWRGQK